MTQNLLSVLTTGGTVSAIASSGRAVPSATAEVIQDSLDQFTVRARDVLTLSSREVGPEDIWELAQEIDHEVDSGATGIVVTHGTDTMEETAYGLALLTQRRVPIVLTGAMRPTYVDGADGLANIRAAATVAATVSMSAYGPVVVMHDEVHLASLVTKVRSTRVAAFGSPSAGPIGQMIEGELLLLLGPSPQVDRLERVAAPHKHVEIVTLVGGDDGRSIESAGERSDGIVIAAVGAGHMSAAAARAAERAVCRGTPVVLTSRCSDPLVLGSTYGGPGSETELLRSGLVRTRFLTPAKARLRLIFGLSAGMSALDLFSNDNPKEMR